MDADDRRAVAEELVYLERYEQLRPKDPFAAAWRAGLYVELHRFDEARELLLGCAERLNASKGRPPSVDTRLGGHAPRSR